MGVKKKIESGMPISISCPDQQTPIRCRKEIPFTFSFNPSCRIDSEAQSELFIDEICTTDKKSWTKALLLTNGTPKSSLPSHAGQSASVIYPEISLPGPPRSICNTVFL
jgi:hypothetical protein